MTEPASPNDATRYSRQTLFRPLGPEGQARLRRARILLVGCGALGSHAAEYLVRAGVGTLRLVDRDVVEWSNLGRQLGYRESDAAAGLPKATALAAHLGEVNRTVAVEALVREFDHANALPLARDVDLILDGTDNLPARFLLNDVAYRLKIPWIYAGAIGGTAHIQFFSGVSGPCLRCQLRDLPPPGSIATCDTAGVIAPAAGVAASWQVAWALRFLAEGQAKALAGRKAMFDLWDGQARIIAVAPDPHCPVCAAGRFDALSGNLGERATLLCGRKAVQVLPAATPATAMDLERLAERLRPLGEVEAHPQLLRLEAHEGYRLTLFEDGRALFDGLTDKSRARSLYDRIVGQ